jgi:hypothetical protein
MGVGDLNLVSVSLFSQRDRFGPVKGSKIFIHAGTFPLGGALFTAKGGRRPSRIFFCPEKIGEQDIVLKIQFGGFGEKSWDVLSG